MPMIAQRWMRIISTASRPCRKALCSGASTPYGAVISFSPMCRCGIPKIQVTVCGAHCIQMGTDMLVYARSCSDLPITQLDDADVVLGAPSFSEMDASACMANEHCIAKLSLGDVLACADTEGLQHG